MEISELQHKAATDLEFRTRLLANPRETLAACDISIPEGVGIHLVEMAEDTLTIPIPPLATTSEELTDEALGEVVAAGSAGPKEIVYVINHNRGWTIRTTDINVWNQHKQFNPGHEDDELSTEFIY